MRRNMTRQKYVRAYSVAFFRSHRERESQFLSTNVDGWFNKITRATRRATGTATLMRKKKKIHYLSASVGSIVK